MRIKFRQGEKTEDIEVAEGAPVHSLINNLKLNDETFLIRLNGRIAHEGTQLKEGDELEFLNVIYGG